MVFMYDSRSFFCCRFFTNKLMAVNWHNAIPFTVNNLHTYFCFVVVVVAFPSSRTNTLRTHHNIFNSVWECASPSSGWWKMILNFILVPKRQHTSFRQHMSWSVQFESDREREREFDYFSRSLHSLTIQCALCLSPCWSSESCTMLSTNTLLPWTRLNRFQACINWITVSIDTKSANRKEKKKKRNQHSSSVCVCATYCVTKRRQQTD